MSTIDKSSTLTGNPSANEYGGLLQPRCKASNCRSQYVRGPEKNRFVCLRCNRVFVGDGLPVRPRQLPPLAFWPVRKNFDSMPECFGNRDSECSICTDHCSVLGNCSRASPPCTSDFYSVPKTITVNAESSGEDQHGDVTWTLKVALKEKWLAQWPAYLGTLCRLFVSPRRFFLGAFSSESQRFHTETSTLDPIIFAVYHVSTVTIATVFGTLLLSELGYMGMLRLSSAIRANFTGVSVHLFGMYVGVIPLVWILRRCVRKAYEYRRVDIITADDSRITAVNALKAVSYVVGVDVFGMASAIVMEIVLLGLVSTPPVVDFGLLKLAYLPMMASRMFLLFYSSFALAYACRVPWSPALLATFWWLALPQAFLAAVNLLRLAV